jgi:hypothetical protein
LGRDQRTVPTGSLARQSFTPNSLLPVVVLCAFFLVSVFGNSSKQGVGRSDPAISGNC